MKNLFKILFLVLLLSSCGDNYNTKLIGKIDGIKKGQVFLLQKIQDEYSVIDSVQINNESEFTFGLNINSPELFLVKTSVKDTPYLQIFAEKGQVKFKGSIDNLYELEFEGSKNQELLNEFNKIQRQFNIRDNEIFAREVNILKDYPEANTDSIYQQRIKNEQKRKLYAINFALSHSDYDIAPFVAINYLDDQKLSTLDTINKSLSTEVKSGIYAKELEELIKNKTNANN